MTFHLGLKALNGIQDIRRESGPFPWSIDGGGGGGGVMEHNIGG